MAKYVIKLKTPWIASLVSVFIKTMLLIIIETLL